MVFHCVPPGGTIGPTAILPLTITFHPSSLDAVAVTKVEGRIRIRSLVGFPLCHMPLHGSSGCKFRVLTPTLDFGICALKRKRVLPLMIKNLSDSEFLYIHLFYQPQSRKFEFKAKPAQTGLWRRDDEQEEMTIADTTKSYFWLAAQTAHIKPLATACVNITFRGYFHASYEERLTIVGDQLDSTSSVFLRALVGDTLSVDVHEVDFGRIDASALDEKIVKTIHLTNKNKAHSLSLSFNMGSSEFSVADVVIPPSSTITHDVVFSPSMLGEKKVEIMCLSPDSPTIVLLATAQVGPALSMPSAPLLFFPVSRPNTYSELAVPLMNTTTTAVKFSVEGLNNTPFYFCLEGDVSPHIEYRIPGQKKAQTPIPTDLGKTARALLDKKREKEKEEEKARELVTQPLTTTALRENKGRTFTIAPMGEVTIRFYFVSKSMGFYHGQFYVTSPSLASNKGLGLVSLNGTVLQALQSMKAPEDGKPVKKGAKFIELGSFAQGGTAAVPETSVDRKSVV